MAAAASSSSAASASSSGGSRNSPTAARARALGVFAPSASKPSKTRPTSTPASTKNVSILHIFDGESFQRHYIEQDPGKRHLSDAHKLISQFYNTREISDNTSSVQQYWKQRKYLRKNIWLETWLRQDIQALTLDENVDAIVYHIHGVIESFMKRQEKEHASSNISPEKKMEEFRSLLSDAARPFLGRAARFVTEVELFLVSHLNIDAYSRVRVRRFEESASHVTREQNVLPHDWPLEDHYWYFVSDENECSSFGLR